MWFLSAVITLQDKSNMRGVERSQLGAKKKVHLDFYVFFFFAYSFGLSRLHF